MRRIVLPGDFLSSNPKVAGYGTYVEGDKVYAKILGLFDETDNSIRVIPLKGKYVPSVGDTIIGIVREVSANGWTLDINSPYQAF
ncbi:MAG: RNA-binding protein, partial [Archaeoglobaceae archaeon]